MELAVFEKLAVALVLFIEVFAKLKLGIGDFNCVKLINMEYSFVGHDFGSS